MVLASLSYAEEHVKYHEKLMVTHPQTPGLKDVISLNLLFKLTSDHIMFCMKLHSGSDAPKCKAFLLYFSEVFHSLSRLEFVQFGEDGEKDEVHEPYFLVTLIAITQSDMQQALSNFISALLNLKTSTLNRQRIAKMFRLGLNWFQNREVVLKSKVYKQADRDSEGAGGGFAKLFRHYSALFKMYIDLISSNDKKEEVTSPSDNMRSTDL